MRLPLLLLLLACVLPGHAATQLVLPAQPADLTGNPQYGVVYLPGDYDLACRLLHAYNAQQERDQLVVPTLADCVDEGRARPSYGFNQDWTHLASVFNREWEASGEGLHGHQLLFPLFDHQALDRQSGEPYSTGVLVCFLPQGLNQETVQRSIQNSYLAFGYHGKIMPKLHGDAGLSLGGGIGKIWKSSGLAQIGIGNYLMIAIGLLLFYLGIVKGFEPLLLVPIAMGCIFVNAIGAHMTLAAGPAGNDGGILYYFFNFGINTGIFPLLIFLGVGALTDFGPLLANPWSALLGAAAQFGIFGTFLVAAWVGVFSPQEAGAIAIIGGADGPTSIYVAAKLAPHLLGAIAVAAYSYMALVPIIQPPIMKALTTDDERKIMMEQRKPVSKAARIMFPISVIVLCLLTLPDAVPLIGMLMFGNLLKESGVTDRLSKTAQNELINLVTIGLGLAVGTKLSADAFLNGKTLLIVVLGCAAFCVGTAAGVVMGKLMNRLSGGKINPLIGSAGVSAVPMAARVSQVVGAQYNKQNFLLMHAMGPNVAGVIGSAVAAGILLALLG